MSKFGARLKSTWATLKKKLGNKSTLGTLILGILSVLITTGVLPEKDTTVQIIIVVVATFTGVSFRLAVGKTKG